jgi:proteasome beta subunit
MFMDNDKYFKGTTTVGVVCTDGIVLASEQRATMGNFIASKTAKKVYQIDDLVGMTIAGSVGDAQQLVRLVNVESQLYKMRRNESMTIKGIATLMSNFLNANRYYPMMVQLLIGGVDKNGPSIYSLDPLGGSIEEARIAATGSGSPMAYGVLEDKYKEDVTVKEGLDLAIRAIHNATKRDSASGENIDVVVITKGEFRRMSPEEVKAIRVSLNQ